MERKIVQKPNKFEVGQITFCNGGCTMQLPTFYKVVKRTEKTVWLIELESQLVEHDGYGQVGHKIPVDIQKGAVFYRRVKTGEIVVMNFKNLHIKETGELLNLGTAWQNITTV